VIASLLVANRGEIAVRIFRTARAMGVKCIAVYSDADAKAKHVRDADVALRIGPPPAKESYLNSDAILRAAKESGAEAIHPGYGFLSENPDFAQAVIAAGLIWVGPTPAAIRAMGLKDEAKRIAEEAGVPVLPGYSGADQSEKVLREAAKEVGFPVLIKAVAGGGGRGIREVRNAGEFSAALASAKRESAAAFGDDRVLIEKFIARARHIEVQVFGDSHGNLVHLYERDCSLQRRRQKVIEEAPAPGMTDEVRAAMTDAALKLARAVNYENAGTVEFIVDATGPLRPNGFWFMEMNTRLQVEHPVTEAVTGLDLVEWQLRVASGEALPLKQEEIALNGHAIEARICAEDPMNDFAPSAGRVVTFEWPLWRPKGFRVDFGFDNDDRVPAEYDSLVAKAIALGSERPVAALADELASVCVAGVRTNIAFLVRCLSEADFQRGAIHTNLIAEKIAGLIEAPSPALVAGCFALSELANESGGGPFSQLDGFRANGAPRRQWWFATDRGAVDVCVEKGCRDGQWRVTSGSVSFGFERFRYVDAHFSVLIDGVRYSGDIRSLPTGETLLSIAGHATIFRNAASDVESVATSDVLTAPLPGKIVALNTAPGASVKRGDPLIVVEAMKMEHALKAPRDGVVAEIGAKEGEQVKQGQILVKLAAREEKQ
jgi:acetyl/propionyl-CoA carboxylase alpha subunit